MKRYPVTYEAGGLSSPSLVLESQSIPQSGLFSVYSRILKKQVLTPMKERLRRTGELASKNEGKANLFSSLSYEGCYLGVWSRFGVSFPTSNDQIKKISHRYGQLLWF